jgi:hypothetical protein
MSGVSNFSNFKVYTITDNYNWIRLRRIDRASCGKPGALKHRGLRPAVRYGYGVVDEWGLI